MGATLAAAVLQAAVSEIIAVERRWVEAHRTLDVYVLEELMADDYTHLQPDGTVADKETDLASYLTGKRHWDFAESDQYHIRVYDDVAILMGRWRARGVNAGQRFDYTARFTSVYVKRNRRWQMVHAQSTPMSVKSSG